jgi:CubicO group peptidase (beta-lactamase class C family)
MTVPVVPLTDWDGSVEALATQPPDWAPGHAIGEHAQTFGHLVGEVVRRVDGRSLGQFLRDELAGPLGLDVHIGLGPAELARASDTVGLDEAWWSAARGEPGSLRYRALGPWVDVNDAAWRRAEIPAVNGFATARGLASFWQAFLDGRLPAGVGEPGVSGHDLFVDDDVTWTLAGGRLDGPDVGMGGLGGQWAAAGPSLRLAWAFLTNRVGDHDRAQRVEDALMAVLAD